MLICPINGVVVKKALAHCTATSYSLEQTFSTHIDLIVLWILF
jgi:hypothetical protein